MKIVSQLLKSKNSEIVSILPTETVFNALKTMADKDIGAILVVENKKVLGIFSERDYARKIILQNRSSKDTLVKDVMITKVVYVTLEDSLEDCMLLMTEKRIRHLPVLENGELLGVISIGDVVKATISQKNFEIQEMVKYILG
jgi:CBS domain-containing protein